MNSDQAERLRACHFTYHLSLITSHTAKSSCKFYGGEWNKIRDELF